MFPEVVLRRGERDLHKWPPLGPLRLADQAHVRFARKLVAFARVAADARTHHVFPCRGSAAVARHDVIQIELAAVENLAAVLAGVLVSLKNIVACKLYFLLREPIENQQHDHPRNTNLERNGRNHFMVRRVGR